MEGVPVSKPCVGVIMGSQSDWPTMKHATDILDELGVAYETKIVSAHRTPDRLWEYGKTAASKGLKVQMPKGFPVGTMAIGQAGAANAGLMAAAILANEDEALAKRLAAWREALSASIPDEPVDD